MELAPEDGPSAHRLARRRHQDHRVRGTVYRLRLANQHLNNDEFAPALRTFAKITLLLSDCYERIHRRNPIGSSGELGPSINTINRLANTQLRYFQALGLTPDTRRNVIRDHPVDLVSLMAQHIEPAEQPVEPPEPERTPDRESD